MRNSTKLNMPPNSPASALLFLPVPSQNQGGQELSWTGDEHHQASPHLRFSMFALEKTQELQDTSCLVKTYLCILEDLGSVPYLHCFWLSVGSVILAAATVLVLQRPFELENNWIATERRKCPLHLYHASYHMLWGRQCAKWLFLETFVAGLVTAKGRMGSERCSQSQPCTKGGMGNGKSPPNSSAKGQEG